MIEWTEEALDLIIRRDKEIKRICLAKTAAEQERAKRELRYLNKRLGLDGTKRSEKSNRIENIFSRNRLN